MVFIRCYLQHPVLLHSRILFISIFFLGNPLLTSFLQCTVLAYSSTVKLKKYLLTFAVVSKINSPTILVNLEPHQYQGHYRSCISRQVGFWPWIRGKYLNTSIVTHGMNQNLSEVSSEEVCNLAKYSQLSHLHQEDVIRVMAI